MDKLYFLTGPLQGATAELIGEEITIGRAPDNGICLDDDSISDHHAIITRKDRECILRDLQSARGTTVRGNRVIVVTLGDSDRIAFGSVEAEFTTTEIKLHMPKTAVLPVPAPQTFGSKHIVSANNSPSGPSFGSMFKAAMAKLLALVVMSGILGGAYVAYNKYAVTNMSQEEQASPLSSQQSAATTTPLQPLNTSATVPNQTPQIAPSAPNITQPTQPPTKLAAPPATTVPIMPSATATVSAAPAGVAAQQQQASPGMLPASAQPQIVSSVAALPQAVVAPPAPPPVAVPGAYPVPGGASVSMSPPTSRNFSQRRVAPPTQSSATDIRKLEPEDWVRGLPVEAQSKYFEIRAALRGNERIQAFQHWISLWRKFLRDPNLALVELDFIKSNIDNRNPSLYEKIHKSNKLSWRKHEAAIRLRLTVLDSMDNMLRALHVRVPKHPELLRMIGEYTDLIARERTQLVEALA